jgi:RNA polymerase primary sigma factor
MVSDIEVHRDLKGRAYDDFINDTKSAAEYAPLTLQEEFALADRIQGGDEDAVHELVLHNIRFIIAMAKKFAVWRNVPVTDLVNDAYIGAITAARNYDKEYGYRFITYGVFYILSALQRASLSYDIVASPKYSTSGFLKISRFTEGFQDKHHRFPSQQEIREGTGVSRAVVQASYNHVCPPVSLDGPSIGLSGKESTLLNKMERDLNPCLVTHPEQEAEAKHYNNENVVKAILDSCSDEERDIIMEMYYKDKNSKEISDERGTSPYLIRKVIDRVIIRTRRRFKGVEFEEVVSV